MKLHTITLSYYGKWKLPIGKSRVITLNPKSSWFTRTR